MFTARYRRGYSYRARDKRGKVRVVCQPGSLTRARRDIRAARLHGWRDRPTQHTRKLSAAQARRWTSYNKAFFSVCGYHEIQPAVTASHNNDRVVVMPGIYTEPTSRKVPAFPKECEQYRTTSEKGSGAVSYEYQYHCPNAQALVAVIGRKPGPNPPPPSGPTGRADPHGIPDNGPCIRCNFQIEGSGPAPQNTVIDAGRVASGDGPPIDAKKDVGLKADRADGFVLRDMTIRHAAEHDVYTLEVDGYQLLRSRFMYAGEYGTLTFTSDHGVTNVCEASGSGDAGVYPGGAPDTGHQRTGHEDFYPTYRLNQVIEHCDSHHNNLGYSGTMGNATHVIHNNFYDNATGIATDSFYSSGHPGFPQDSAVFEKNRIYSNNFNIYAPNSKIESTTPVPIGVGIFIAGGNYDQVSNNYIYDNWRRGAMLIAVPDAVACAPSPEHGAPGCAPQGASTTSNFDRYFGNTMGRDAQGKVYPNGVDFWWDEFPSNHDDCFGPNTGSDGHIDTTTTDPPEAPNGQPAPGFIAKRNCGSPANVGIGDETKEAMLFDCAAGDTANCEWYKMPPRPGSGGSSGSVPSTPPAKAAAAWPTPPHLCTLIGGLGGTLTCTPFKRRLG